MPRRALRATLIWIAAGFFLLGLASVLLRPAPSGGNPSSTSTPATPEPDAPQTTVLILGVDDLSSDAPSLQAVWVAAQRPPGREVFLFGLPVDAAGPDGEGLQDSFSWSRRNGPSQEFREAVESLSPVSLDVIVALDEAGFARLIDFLGGVELEQGTVGGSQVLGILGLFSGDASARLEAQRGLLEALVQRIGRVGPGTDLQALVDLVPQHAYLSIPAADALTRLAPLLPLAPGEIRISLPLAGGEG